MQTNKIMTSLLNSTPNADWIKNESKLAWLKLDLAVPIEAISKEWESVKHMAVPHRSNDRFYTLTNVGWESLTIYGASPYITTVSEDPYDWTEVAKKCPITYSWINDNFIINEFTGRIRFMLLKAGGVILPHTDRENKGLGEINVAINNPEGCIFKFTKNGIVPFKDGSAFILDISNEHFVYNNSDTDRLHIIIHNPIKDEILEKSYATCYHNPRY